MTDQNPIRSNGRTVTASRIDHDTVRSASKLVMGALALVFLLGLVTFLPGIDLVVPATSLTIAAVVTAVVAVAIAGLLVYAAPNLAALTRAITARPIRQTAHSIDSTTDSPNAADSDSVHDPISENAAGIVYWLVVLAAVFVLHRGFIGVMTPLLADHVWMYDAAFFVISLVPVTFATARLAATIDPLSDRIADRVVGSTEDD